MTSTPRPDTVIPGTDGPGAEGLGTAAAVIRRLESVAEATDLAEVRRRLPPDEPAIGVAGRQLFDTAAAAATELDLAGVEELLDDPRYEPRLCALCVLDFMARRTPGEQRLSELYLRRHDRITTWDMVDRAAPRVVGGPLLGGPWTLLTELAEAPEPLRRRTAVTAPLLFVRDGADADLSAGFAVAGRLAGDPEPVVSQAVGTFLGHAGARSPLALDAFLHRHARSLPRPVLALAVSRVEPSMAARWLD